LEWCVVGAGFFKVLDFYLQPQRVKPALRIENEGRELVPSSSSEEQQLRYP
jgi:hypothetical protein